MKKIIIIEVINHNKNYYDDIGKMKKIGKYVYILNAISHRQGTKTIELEYINIRDYYKDKFFIKDKKVLNNILDLLEKEMFFTKKINELIEKAQKIYK